MLKDKDIREPLFDFLEDRHSKIRIIEEKTMGKSRADVIMVLENEVVGIEIKSDADTYARLSRQVKDYDRYFDRNIVVVGSRHAHHKRACPGMVGYHQCGRNGWSLRFLHCPRTLIQSEMQIITQNKTAVAPGNCTHSGDQRASCLPAEKQGFCTEENPGESSGRNASPPDQR